MAGLSPNLTSLIYIEYSAAPDPSEKSIMKLYTLRWYADCLANEKMTRADHTSLSLLVGLWAAGALPDFRRLSEID